VSEERSTLHTIRRRGANWISRHLLLNCLLKHVVQGKIEGKGREEEEKDLSSYWITLRKRENTET
jgi:hypothetical protein